MKISILLFVLLFQFSASAQKTLGLNDITILLPLPQTMDELNQFLSPASNELIPKIVYKRMPVLNVEIDQEKNYQYNLKVIGVRFDPCFMEGFAPTTCQPQIRLVWQPIIFKTNGRTGIETASTMDTALHTFYNLNSSEWTQLLADIKSISTFDTTSPLQIHPVLQTERFNGAYWSNLKNIILKYAGKKNLVRTTVMISRNGFVWAFRGVDLVQGQWVEIEIPTIKPPADKADIKVVNDAFFIEPSSLSKLSEFRGGATLLEFNNTTWFNFLSDSEKFLKTQTEDEIKAAMGLAYQLEDPNRHNPATTGCVNCHLAQTVRLWGESHLSWDFNTVFAGEVYLNSQFNLKNMSVNPARSDRLRALGYFGDEPIFSQRVINETAQILTNPL